MIRTVLGDVDPTQLGPTDYHEHLFQVSPLLSGDELDDEELSKAEAATLVSAGVTAMIEATPLGLGARPGAVARISAATGLQVVHTTGAHHSGHYAGQHPVLSMSEQHLAARFTADVQTGLLEGDGTPALAPGGAPVRAGIIKGSARYWSIGPFEQRVLAAVASAHRATGAPVMVHLDSGSAAHEVLDLLAERGVASERVVLAHVDRNLDPGLHLSLTQRGAYLGFDGVARHREAPDSAILDCLVALIEAGGGERILLGGDVARATRYRAYGGLPGLDYLPVRFLPRLTGAVGDAVVHQLVTGNPARLLTVGQ